MLALALSEASDGVKWVFELVSNGNFFTPSTDYEEMFAGITL